MINNRPVDKIIAEILQYGLELEDSQIWLRMENRQIPNNDKLYCVVGMVDQPQVMAAPPPFLEEREVPQPDPDPPIIEVYEINQLHTKENIQIDVASFSEAALNRRWQVITSLRSIFSLQTQEKNSFKIFRVPASFTNTGDAEGGSNLKRYTIIIQCFAWYRQERLLTPDGKQYYDSFETRVDDEETIGTPDGLFKFTITEPEE